MYSKLFVLCLAAACVSAAPASTDVVPLEKQQPTVIPIVSQSEELESNGTYKFSYETGNGIKREETSYDKTLPKVEGRSAAGSNEGGESDESNEIHVQRGSYSYTAPDGTVISVRYIADENGFRPTGDHIPPSIVAAAASAGSSAEKSGRALNVADSADSASAPVAKASKAPTPAAGKPEDKESKAKAESPIEPKIASSAEAGKPTEASAEATEKASETSGSTTESASTANVSNDASTVANEGTTAAADTTTKAAEAAEATTKATEATTAAATEAPQEPSSTSADASTTEAASTASA